MELAGFELVLLPTMRLSLGGGEQVPRYGVLMSSLCSLYADGKPTL
jgi:hypothetical protein